MNLGLIVYLINCYGLKVDIFLKVMYLLILILVLEWFITKIYI